MCIVSNFSQIACNILWLKKDLKSAILKYNHLNSQLVSLIHIKPSYAWHENSKHLKSFWLLLPIVQILKSGNTTI